MIKFKELPNEEKPRERLYMYGANSLSNEELLMILLKTGTKKYSVKELANQIFLTCGGIDKIRDVTYSKLLEIDGIGHVKAIELLAQIEFAKRIMKPVTVGEMIRCTTPSMIVNYFNFLFLDKKQEEFYVLYLNHKKKYLDHKRLFVGSINSSVVHPREIFKKAYLLSASFFICIHNHPSGDPTPSREDTNLTKHLMEIGNLHAIYLVDHIVVGHNCYYSFYEDGNVFDNK